ncbi:hypothetical protein SAMN05444487_10915 [Marininema mesophilum]|uniref:Uncharacterized protein n=1 Tax=Marininema mesophilum TaxID=1048340 RepID=A0A1H2YC92_9BACL|nr:hypothetical protein [Marininema mesophilum]SDX02448.1 hypothetical protein SAMN05444487_10915 [Marininema mesophilum]
MLSKKKWLLALMLAAVLIIPTAATSYASSAAIVGDQTASKQDVSTQDEEKTVVTASGTIADVRGYDDEKEHQHILVDNLKVEDVENGDASQIPDRAFVSIRIDQQGTDGEIPDLKKGEPIKLKGEFIPEDEAYKTPHNCCDAVIHFVHDPLGYIEYGGKVYK